MRQRCGREREGGREGERGRERAAAVVRQWCGGAVVRCGAERRWCGRAVRAVRQWWRGAAAVRQRCGSGAAAAAVRKRWRTASCQVSSGHMWWKPGSVTRSSRAPPLQYTPTCPSGTRWMPSRPSMPASNMAMVCVRLCCVVSSEVACARGGYQTNLALAVHPVLASFLRSIARRRDGPPATPPSRCRPASATPARGGTSLHAEGSGYPRQTKSCM